MAGCRSGGYPPHVGRRLGRYVILDELAAGGMGRVHLGRLRAEGGFSRVVAIKALHAQYARDSEVRRMFLDEARLVASIRHPNVVSTLDVLEDRGELFLIMDYVNGLPLSQIIRDVRRVDGDVPILMVAAIMIDALEGLHAAHEARGQNGALLNIVHRDVSPQNVMVGNDGMARVVDFGVAHASDRLQQTIPGQIKGKASYMSPEQATDRKVDRRADIYGAAIVLWEALAGARLFQGSSFSAVILRHLQEQPMPPSTQRPDVPTALDAIVLRGLSKHPEERFATAHEMAEAIERAVGRASRSELASWLQSTESAFFAEREALLARLARAPEDGPDEMAHDVASPSNVPTLLEPPGETAEASVGATPATIGEDGPSRVRRRSRQTAALLIAAAMIPVVIVWIVSTRRPAPASVEQSPTGSVATARTSRPPEAQQDSSSSSPRAAAPPTSVTVVTSDAAVPRKPARRASASPTSQPTASALPLPPTSPCCTPDGTLQLRFHDCTNNCTN